MMSNLIMCPMCDAAISPNASACPMCGEPASEAPAKMSARQEVAANSMPSKNEGRENGKREGKGKKFIRYIALIAVFFTAIAAVHYFVQVVNLPDGSQPSEQDPLFRLSFIFLYFVPSIIAVIRGHRSIIGITTINIVLGMVIIGWVIALIWALLDFSPVPPERYRWRWVNWK